MAELDDIQALLAQFDAPELTPFGQPQTLAGLGFEQPSWMAEATPQAVMPEPVAPAGLMPVAPPAVEPVPVVPSFGTPIETAGDDPLKAALAGIGTADLVEAEETGRAAARLDAANELMATNPYAQEAVPSLVQETPQIDFDALVAQLSKAGS